MFSNLFNFQAKKDGKSKSEDGKKSKSKKLKDSKSKDVKESEIVIQDNESLKLSLKEDEEHFEDVSPNDLSSNNLCTDGLLHNGHHHIGNGAPPTEELLIQLETVEGEARRLADGLEQMTADKAALEREMSGLRSENERLRASTETMVAEKWELSAANADLQNRLQNMAMTIMQGMPDTMLQDELHKLQAALSDERKVTEKLSRNLELEKRRSESLEQKAKSANRRSGASVSGTTLALPEEVRQRDDSLSNSMEKYRLHLERMSSSLEDCEKKLIGFEIQEDYHAADLRKELSSVKRILTEERRRSSGESQKLFDVQTIFSQVYKEYTNLAESLKNQEKRARAANSHDDGHQHQHGDPELLHKLRRAQEELEYERQKFEQANEKLRKLELEIESLPLLRAQVEVYQADFNAEREARQKIAGEKSDLLDELQRLKREQRGGVVETARIEEVEAPRRPPQRAAGETPRLIPTTNFVRETANQFAEMGPPTTSPPPRPAKAKDTKLFSCPKCEKSFPILQILQTHVNACLDRD